MQIANQNKKKKGGGGMVGVSDMKKKNKIHAVDMH